MKRKTSSNLKRAERSSQPSADRPFSSLHLASSSTITPAFCICSLSRSDNAYSRFARNSSLKEVSTFTSSRNSRLGTDSVSNSPSIEESSFIHLPLQSAGLVFTFRFHSNRYLHLVVCSSESPGETGCLDKRILRVI